MSLFWITIPFSELSSDSFLISSLNRFSVSFLRFGIKRSVFFFHSASLFSKSLLILWCSLLINLKYLVSLEVLEIWSIVWSRNINFLLPVIFVVRCPSLLLDDFSYSFPITMFLSSGAIWFLSSSVSGSLLIIWTLLCPRYWSKIRALPYWVDVNLELRLSKHNQDSFFNEGLFFEKSNMFK